MNSANSTPLLFGTCLAFPRDAMLKSFSARHTGRTVRGVFTVYRRRGFRYLIRLITGFGRLQALYRFGWGPRAPQPARAAFALASGVLATRAPSNIDYFAAGVASDAQPVERGEIDVDTAAELMDRAHAAGITGLADAFDRLGRTSASALRFTSLPNARAHRWHGAFYLAARDADRRMFNARFGANLLTEADARRQLATLKARIPGGYREYAPIDFGGGLSVGRIATTDSGTGRWDFFNGPIVGPLVAGKRVLDLGCNNGSLSLMMLRAGAREVVAIELTSAIAEIARLNGRILAWRDACRYKLDVINGDMRMWLTSDLGTFDVITAFCSLYYLPEVDMVRVIRKAADMGSTLVLQANEAIDNLPARARTLRELMTVNGYARVEMFNAEGFARPLLVGTAPAGVASVR